jgi:hypothetical protein
VTRKAFIAWLLKLFGLGSSIAFGFVTIWYAYEAWKDGHCSAELAKWTAMKDFWEHCLQVRFHLYLNIVIADSI